MRISLISDTHTHNLLRPGATAYLQGSDLIIHAGDIGGPIHDFAGSEDGIYVNPGSAGPRRFKLPITVAELLIDGRAVSARIAEI